MAFNKPKENEASHPSTGLFNTSVTLDSLEKKIQEALNTSAKFGPNVSTEQIGFGLGFLSVMVRLKPDWQGDNTDGLPKSFAVKIPSMVTMQLVTKQANYEDKMKDSKIQFNMEEQMKAFDAVLKSAHATETSFYDLVRKDALKLNIPKCYILERFGSNGENGFLIMEDLGGIGATKPIYETLSVESVKTVLDNLAEVHSYSLQNDQWLSNPELKMTFGTFQKLSGDSFKPMMLSALEMLKKDHPAVFDPLLDRLQGICEKEMDLAYVDTMHEKLGHPPVLTHGDLWMNNMMWRKMEDGKSTTDELVAIVDWQLVHPGCIGEDFVRLLCSSAAPNDRRERLEEFVEHYHSSLKSKLGKEPPFTVAQIINAYKHLFRYGAVMVLPMVAGFLQAELGMMGIENIEQRKQDMLNRAKCLVEEVYDIDDELALIK